MRQPFFVVGTGRCGSTLLSRLLEVHPSIAMTNEARILDALWFMFRFASLPAFEEHEFVFSYPVRLHGWVGRDYVDDFAAVLRAHAVPMLEQFYERHFAGKQFTHYGDKLPGVEAALAITELLPQTRFVVLSRDPRDVLCSWRSFAEAPRADNPLLVAPHLEDHAHNWKNLYGGAMRYLQDSLLVRYEDLVADQRGTLQRVMQFLDLATADEQLAVLDQQKLFAVHGTSATPEASIQRWRRDLPDAERQVIESICGDVMQSLGYAVDAR